MTYQSEILIFNCIHKFLVITRRQPISWNFRHFANQHTKVKALWGKTKPCVNNDLRLIFAHDVVMTWSFHEVRRQSYHISSLTRFGLIYLLNIFPLHPLLSTVLSKSVQWHSRKVYILPDKWRACNEFAPQRLKSAILVSCVLLS